MLSVDDAEAHHMQGAIDRLREALARIGYDAAKPLKRKLASKQISAIERLRELPPVFRGANLTIRFRWDSKTASQYLYLWKRRNLVKGLGGHSDVFANLLIAQYPDWEKALLMAMPSAVVVGVEVLRRAGWSTQIPQRPNVAVTRSIPYSKRTSMTWKRVI